MATTTDPVPTTTVPVPTTPPGQAPPPPAGSAPAPITALQVSIQAFLATVRSSMFNVTWSVRMDGSQPVQTHVAVAPLAYVTATGCPTTGTRPYFPQADWLWSPIPANPALDPASRAIVANLAQGQHVANLGDYGVALRGPSGITAATPRFPVKFSETGQWGPDPFGGRTMPIPAGTQIPPGSDGHLSVADPTTNSVFNLWMAKSAGASWRAGWGSVTPLNGDGRETTGSSTGSGIARFAAVVRSSEIASATIPHALFFSSDMVTKRTLRYPATKTDGSNDAGLSVTLPEGSRVQLDPALDVAKLPGLSPAERTVARALQTYGAYVGDNGGARMAFAFEYAPGTSAYATNGLSGSYGNLSHIPFDKLRVLNSWDGR